MIQEYRGLTIVFAIIALGLAAYFVKWLVRGPPVPAPPPPQSVYIDVVPRTADPPPSP
jgi:hypothetical protein